MEHHDGGGCQRADPSVPDREDETQGLSPSSSQGRLPRQRTAPWPAGVVDILNP